MSVAARVAARNCDARLHRYWRLKKSSRVDNPAPKTQTPSTIPLRLELLLYRSRRLRLYTDSPSQDLTAPPIAREGHAPQRGLFDAIRSREHCHQSQNTAARCEIAPARLRRLIARHASPRKS